MSPFIGYAIAIFSAGVAFMPDPPRPFMGVIPWGSVNLFLLAQSSAVTALATYDLIK